MALKKVRSFTKSVTNSAAAIRESATQTKIAQNALLFAPSTNTAVIYISDSAVSSVCWPMAAGSTLNLGDVFNALNRGELDLSSIYALAASGTQSLIVLTDVDA